jgi:hypothetical protein
MNGRTLFKNRRRFTSSLDNQLVPLFDALAAKTRIPKSRLLDEAIEDLFSAKHGVPGKKVDSQN